MNMKLNELTYKYNFPQIIIDNNKYLFSISDIILIQLYSCSIYPKLEPNFIIHFSILSPMSTISHSKSLNPSNSTQFSLLPIKDHRSQSTSKKNTSTFSHLPENSSLPFALHPAAKCIGTHNLKP